MHHFYNKEKCLLLFLKINTTFIVFLSEIWIISIVCIFSIKGLFLPQYNRQNNEIGKKKLRIIYIFYIFGVINIIYIFAYKYLHNGFRWLAIRTIANAFRGKIKIKYIQEGIGMTIEIYMPPDSFL